MDAKDMKALLTLDQSAQNVEFMLGQFAARYLGSVASGKSSAWFAAIRSYLDLAESGGIEFQKRMTTPDEARGL